MKKIIVIAAIALLPTVAFANNLSDLNDVNGGASEGQVLVHNNGSWTPTHVSFTEKLVFNHPNNGTESSSSVSIGNAHICSITNQSLPENTDCRLTQAGGNWSFDFVDNNNSDGLAASCTATCYDLVIQ